MLAPGNAKTCAAVHIAHANTKTYAGSAYSTEPTRLQPFKNFWLRLLNAKGMKFVC